MTQIQFVVLWSLAFLSPIAAIFVAARFYAVHSYRRPEPGRHFTIVTYIAILLGCAIVAFPFGTFYGIAAMCTGPGAGNLCGLVGFFVTGPFASSLAIVLVGGLIAILPADEPAVLPAGAPRPILVGQPVTTSAVSAVEIKSPWWQQLWRGDYSLARSFWGFFILGTIVGSILGMNPIFMFFRLAFLFLLLFQLLFLSYQITAGVGVWRSADALTAAQQTNASLKALAAKIVVVLVVGIHGMM